MSTVRTKFSLQRPGTLQEPRRLPIATLSPEILMHAYSLTCYVSYHYDCAIWSCHLDDQGFFLNFRLDCIISLFKTVVSISHPIFLDLDC